IVADGAVRPFDGDLDDYRESLLNRAPEPPAPAVVKKPQARKSSNKNLESRIKRLEELMARLTSQKADIDARLADPATYQDPDAAAQLVGKYRFYFAYPALAAQAGSVLAAIGLAGMVLALWLMFRQAFVQGVLVGLNLFAVAWLTRKVAPLYALRVQANRGNR